MMLNKPAPTNYDIHGLLKNRWSPRAFAPKEVEKEKVLRFMEAARWAPSSSNEQPWRFIVGFKGDESYQKIFDSLVEFNQLWAKTAPILLLAIGNTRSLKDPSKPSQIYKYDVGQAIAHLTFQASADDLFVHQMGGFSSQKAAELFQVPEDFEVLTVTAIGYMGDPGQLPDNLSKMEYNKRERQPLTDMVFTGKFGEKTVL